MKKYIYYFAAMLCVGTLLSCKSSNAIFDLDFKPKTLYMGFNNKMFVNSPNVHKITVSSDNADCSIAKDSVIIIKPKKQGVVVVNLKYKNKTRSLGFIAQEVPNPYLSFRGRMYEPGKTIPKDEANRITMAGVVMPNFVYDCKLELISMKLDIIKSEGTVRHFDISGNNLRGIFMGAQVGDTYIFSDINVQIVGAGKVKGTDTVIKIVENNP